MKTPEEMAEEWAHVPRVDQDMDECDLTWDNVFDWEVKSFLAGYQAAKDEYKTKISELEIELENWKHTAIHGNEGL